MTKTRPVKMSVYSKGISAYRRLSANSSAVVSVTMKSTAGAILQAGDFAVYLLGILTFPHLNSQKSDAMAPLLIPVDEPKGPGSASYRQANNPETGFQGLIK